MKFLRLVILLIVGSVVYQSCSSSFNPAANYKNIPVIYGLLNLSDSIHIIKIEKAFLTQTGNNAYTAAQVADSIYYPTENVNASLQAYSNNSPTGSPIPLIRADGATLGLNKDTGVFASSPNIIYYTRAALNSNYSYELILNNTQNGQVTTSLTNLVDSFYISNPTLSAAVDFNPQYAFTTVWSIANNAAVYQLVIRFHYEEFPISNTSDISYKTLTWTFPSQVSTGANTNFQYIPGIDFYMFVASQIPVNSAVERKATSFDFWIYGGGSQLYTYQTVSIAGSTSLVEGQINPNYTDITNGIGLFSSTIFEAENGLSVKNTTMDSLAYSSVTTDLNFLDQNGVR